MKKAYRVLFFTMAVLVLLAVLFFAYLTVETGLLKDVSHLENADLNSLVPQSVKVEGIPLYTQPDPYSCGITTISILVSLCTGQDLPPLDLIEKYDLPGGMNDDTFVDILARELPEYRVDYRHGLSDGEMIGLIHGQLQRGLPVPVFFSAANPHNEPYYDFHASLVNGIDLVNQQIHIINVYGYEEQIELVEFLNRMSYRPTKNFPLVQRIVLKLGFIDKNSIFLLTKK